MDLSGIVIDNTFRLDKKISETDISDCYFVQNFHIDESDPLVIKVFKNPKIIRSAEELLRLKHELSSIADLNHPNIIKIYGHGEVFKLPFVVMEFVHGKKLSSLFEEQKISIEQAIDIITQICRALEYLHANQILHRGLNPDNILVFESENRERLKVKLKDIGFPHIKHYQEMSLNNNEESSIFEYLSPEQVNLQVKQIDERSDLFSMGVLFYRLLTGKVPYNAKDLFLSLGNQAIKMPAKPGESNPLVPGVIDSIVMKLIDRDPGKRYQKASSVIADLERFFEGERDFIVGLNDSEIKLTYHAGFIGRKNEFNILKDAFEYIKRGNAGTCLISGESGIGKTRIISELNEYINLRDGAVIYGKCTAGRINEPYGLIKDLLSSYIDVYNSYDNAKKSKISEALQSSVGMLGEIVLRINPQMNEIIGQCPPLVTINPDDDNKRFYMIAGQFFIDLSRIEAGLVLSIDDLQWIDDGSLELLDRITDKYNKSPLLILGAYRNDEITDSHKLYRFIEKVTENGEVLADIEVRLFDSSEMYAFTGAILPGNKENIEEISDFIHMKSKGNPLFAIEIIKQLINDKILIYDKSRWDVDASILNNIIIPPSVIDILLKRISLLTEKEKMVLSYASVIGQTFDIDLLLKLFSDISRDELLHILDNCVQYQLIDLVSVESPRWSFVHDRIYESLYSLIDETPKKEMHHKIAETLEAMYQENHDVVLFQLANHYIESGDSEKILTYTLPASFKSALNFANEDAMRYYNIIIDILNQRLSSGDEQARKLWLYAKEGLAGVYLRIGKHDDSINLYNELILYTKDYTKKTFYHSNISNAYYRKGDLKLSEIYAKIGIDELGGTFPMERKAVIRATVKEIFIHILHILFPLIFVRKGPPADDSKILLQSIFFETLIMMYAIKSRVKYIWSVLKILNHVERYIGSDQSMVKTLYSFAFLLIGFGWYGSSVKYLNKAFSLAKKLEDPLLIATYYFHMGVWHEWQGDFLEAIKIYTIARDKYLELGTIYGAGYVYNALCSCYLFLTEYDNLLKSAEKLHETANSSQNSYLACNAFLYKSTYYIGKGDYDMAMINARKAFSISAEKELWMPHCIANYLIGMIHFCINDYTAAIPHYQKAIELYETHKFLKYYTIQAYPLLCDALIGLYKNHLKNGLFEEAAKVLHEIKKYSKLSLKLTRKFPSAHKYSLVVSAKYHAIMGRKIKAHRLFLKCIELCTQLNMKFDLAWSLFEYGIFLKDTGEKDKSRNELELAYHIFKEVGAIDYAEKVYRELGFTNEKADSSILQQMIYKKKLELIDSLSMNINQVTDINLIYSSVIKDVSAITGADHILLFMADENNELSIQASSDIDQLDDEIVSMIKIKSVLKSASKEIHNSVNETGDIIDDSERSDTVSSVAYIPVTVKDRVLGVFLLEKSSARGLFSDDDIELCEIYLSKIVWSMNYLREFQKIRSSKEDSKLKISSSNEDKIKRVISYIEENYMFNISREGLASFIDSNPDYFGRCFKLYTGLKINEYINKVRVEEAAKKLRETDEKIIDIALSVGFENLSTFNKSFYKVMNIIPRKYRKMDTRQR